MADLLSLKKFENFCQNQESFQFDIAKQEGFRNFNYASTSTSSLNQPSDDAQKKVCRPVTVHWNNIELYGKKGKPLLNKISGILKPGKLTAIMGPSGAGKSTLLNVLAGSTNQKVSGQILVNGTKRCLNTYKRMTCYISQDDHVLPHLTVRETTYFAACLKLPNTFSKEAKEKVVDDILSSLGLAHRQHNKASQLSGGERKRLCIAQEFVSDSHLIYLDEPTSGLDSSSCLHCIKLLKSLAEEGRTVVCTIHQPSTVVFDLFDELYFMASGNCIYRGPTKGLISFLAEQGLHCPPYQSITEYAMEVAVGYHGDWLTKLKLSVDSKEVIDGNSNTSVEISLYDVSERDNQPSKLCPAKDKAQKNQEEQYIGYATSYWNQFQVLTHRSFLCSFREPKTTLVRLISHIIVGVLVGLLYFKCGNDASKVFSNVGFLFFTLIFLCFTAMMPTALTFNGEMLVFSRERLNNWYNIKMYYLAKALSDLPFQLIFPVLYAIIVYMMTGQLNEFYRFMLFTCSMVMHALVAQSFSVIISALSSTEIAVFLCPVLSIPFFLFSNFLILFNNIPVYFRWFSYLSYCRYVFHSAMHAFYSFDREKLECNESLCLFKNPKDILKLFQLLEGDIYVDYAALCGLFLVFEVLGYFALLYRMKR